MGIRILSPPLHLLYPKPFYNNPATVKFTYQQKVQSRHAQEEERETEREREREKEKEKKREKRERERERKRRERVSMAWETTSMLSLVYRHIPCLQNTYQVSCLWLAV